MTITLKAEHESQLMALVAAGAYDSLEDALASAIEHLTVDTDDDLAWAKPLVDQAIAQLERGERHSHDDVFADVREIIAGRA